jgi:hypothetical protein
MFLGISIVFATLFGPIFAVLMTRYLDEKRQIKERRMTVFRALMGTRKAVLSPDRVTALNMIEIEFYGIQPVQQAYRDVMNHINHPKPVPETWGEQQRKYITKLMSEIGKILGYELQQLDVLDGGYHPQGIFDIELEQQAVRRSLIEVLTGNRTLIVSQAAPALPMPFPPPPTPGNSP